MRSPKKSGHQKCGLRQRERAERSGPRLDWNILGRGTGSVGGSHVEIAITTERADDKGWIASAPEVRATAQGSTEGEARANLEALLKRFPDLLDEPRQATDRRVELIKL